MLMITALSARRFTSRLSATPCTPEMKDQVEEAAAELGMSIAEFQRHAVQFFLTNGVKKHDIYCQENGQANTAETEVTEGK